MPAVSQIGFGTNDYADLDAWFTAERDNDYGGAGPIAEIDASASPNLTAAWQLRYGTASKFTVRAAAGSEFDGNLGGTHAKITGGQTIDVRQANVTWQNIEIVASWGSTGDSYDNMTFEGCGLRGQVYLNRAVTNPVTFQDTIVLLELDTYNRAIYAWGTNVDFSGATVIAISPTGGLGAIYVRTNGTTVNINNTAVYSNSLTIQSHSGDTTTINGDYNAGSDGLLPGVNSVATLTTADFVDFDNLDLRIKGDSALIGAGSGGSNIGAFGQAAAPPSTELSFTADNTTPQEGETITLSIANGTGPYTATFDGSAITLATQNASSATINWPSMQAHGSRYNQAADLVLTDTSDASTYAVQITPAVTDGHLIDIIAALTGMYANDTDVSIGDEVVGYIVSGSFDAIDLQNGALVSTSGGTFRYNVFDISAGVWLGSADETIPAYINNAFSILNIDTDNNVDQGQTGVQLNFENAPATVVDFEARLGATVDGNNLTGGTVLSHNGWNGGSPTVDIPAGITPGSYQLAVRIIE